MKVFWSCLLAVAIVSVSFADIVNGPTNGNVEITSDLPVELHQQNKNGRDGSGLCVFTSISVTAEWQNVELLKQFRDYMTQYAGGGDPRKVDQYIKKIAQEKGVPVPTYVQIENDDSGILELAIKTGRMPCITWGTDEAHYHNRRISHMINLVYLDKQWACVLDNNFPNVYLWCTRVEFNQRHAMGGAWSIIFLDMPPPPPPFTGKP